MAVRNNELELNSTELVIKRRDGNGVTVLVPVDQDVAVSNSCSLCDSPCESCLVILDIVCKVGQGEGVCTTVLINCVISKGCLDFRTCSLDVDGELLVGCHRNSVNSSPVVCTVSLGLDHHIVVLCRSCSCGTLVGSVDKNFIADASSFKIVVRCLNGDVLTKCLYTSGDGLSWVNSLDVG